MGLICGIKMLLQLATFSAFASAIVANRFILQSLPVFFFVGIRMLCGGLILLTLSLGSKSGHSLKFANFKKNWPFLIGAILFTTFIPTLLKAYGLKYLFASKSAFIGSLDPFVTAIYAYFLLSERLNCRKIIGIITAFFGAVFLCFSTSQVEQSLHAFLIFSLPELAALGHVALSRLGWTLIQILLKKGHYKSIEINAITMFISGILGLIISYGYENLSCIVIKSPIKIAALFVYTVLIGNVIGYSMYGNMLKKHSANFVSLCGFMIPILVSLIAWIFLGEGFSINLVISAVIIFAGVFIFYKDEIKKLKP